MTDTTSRKRQPRGTTTGGQFATEAKGDSGVSLPAPSYNYEPEVEVAFRDTAYRTDWGSTCYDCACKMTTGDYLDETRTSPDEVAECQGCSLKGEITIVSEWLDAVGQQNVRDDYPLPQYAQVWEHYEIAQLSTADAASASMNLDVKSVIERWNAEQGPTIQLEAYLESVDNPDNVDLHVNRESQRISDEISSMLHSENSGELNVDLMKWRAAVDIEVARQEVGLGGSERDGSLDFTVRETDIARINPYYGDDNDRFIARLIDDSGTGSVTRDFLKGSAVSGTDLANDLENVMFERDDLSGRERVMVTELYAALHAQSERRAIKSPVLGELRY